MKLHLFKTLWGHEAGMEEACKQACAQGFSGIEGPVPGNLADVQLMYDLLLRYELRFIAEITTAGSYVPDRHASLEQHIASLEKKLQACQSLSPLFVTCLGGCDAWPEEKSIRFFEAAMALANDYAIPISFETHRGRSFFNPWVTARICDALPAIKLTCDFSHWCVVCERLLVGEEETLSKIFTKAFHIHARIGYDQGPQVSAPSSSLYEQALLSHESWWQAIWQSQQQRGFEQTTMTPEFGPDGYQAVDAITGEPLGDLWQMNSWVGHRQKTHFDRIFT